MPPELRATLDQSATIAAVAAVQAEIAGLRADLANYVTAQAASTAQMPPAPTPTEAAWANAGHAPSADEIAAKVVDSLPAPTPPARPLFMPQNVTVQGRTSRTLIVLLVIIAAVLIVIALRQPAKAQNVPGTQQYCTTIPSSPAPNGLVPLTCATGSPNGSLNVNISGGSGLTASVTNPYAAGVGQAPTAASFVGVAGFNGVTVDSLFTAQNGNTIGLGQSGFLAVTGGGPSGTFPVELPNPVTVGGSIGQLVQDGSSYLEINCKTGCSGSSYPYSGTSNGQTATTASFLGAGGLYNSAAPTLSNTQFSPLQLDASGNLNVNVKAGGSSTTFPYTYTAAQTATSASFLGVGGYDGTHFQPFTTDTSGRPVVVGAGTAGSAAGGVLTVQGSSSGTAVPVSGTVTATAPYSYTATQTATAGSFTGIGGYDGAHFEPMNVTAAGSVYTTGSGTAGSAAAGVNTVQGITGMTPVQIGSASTTVTIAPTITSSASYSAGNCIGTQGSAGGVGLLTLTSAFRATDDGGVLESIVVTMNETQTTALDVFVLSSAPGTSICNDKGAPAIVVGDSAKVLGEYTLAAPITALGANNTTWNLDGIGKQITSSSTSIYIYVVAVSAVTTTASATMSLSVGILQD